MIDIPQYGWPQNRPPGSPPPVSQYPQFFWSSSGYQQVTIIARPEKEIKHHLKKNIILKTN